MSSTSIVCAMCCLVLAACASSEPEPRAIAAPGDGAPEMLSQTGLFAGGASGELGPGVEEFAVAFPLWSDGADKRRFVRLPEGATIDTTDMDHWSFPVGTRFWKEIASDGVLMETRFIERSGEGPDDFTFASYQWRPDGRDAMRVLQGATDVNGTDYDIPDVSACWTCHAPIEEHILGFGAIQLAHDGDGPTLESLVDGGLLSTPPARPIDVPGDEVAQAALGYLHGNCSHCHNPSGYNSMHLRLSVDDIEVEGSAAFQTAVGVESGFQLQGIDLRIAPGDPDASALRYRMSVRDDDRMPMLGSDVVDPHGLAVVTAWIASLPAVTRSASP